MNIAKAPLFSCSKILRFPKIPRKAPVMASCCQIFCSRIYSEFTFKIYYLAAHLFGFLFLLFQNDANVNVINGMGDTPLHRAAFTGRTVSNVLRSTLQIITNTLLYWLCSKHVLTIPERHQFKLFLMFLWPTLSIFIILTL